MTALGPLAGLVVGDEVQQLPDLFPVLPAGNADRTLVATRVILALSLRAALSSLISTTPSPPAGARTLGCGRTTGSWS